MMVLCSETTTLRGQSINSDESLAIKFSQVFRVSKIRRYSDAERLGTEYARHNAGGTLELFAIAASSVDPYFRHAALSAAVSEPTCLSGYRTLLTRFLYDVQRQNRLKSLELLEKCHSDDPSTIALLVDLSIRDQSNDVAVAANEVLQRSLLRFSDQTDAVTLNVLQNAADDLENLVPVTREQTAAAKLKAASGDIRKSIDRISRAKARLVIDHAASIPVAQPQPLYYATAAWLNGRTKLQTLALAAGLAVIFVHFYYLALLLLAPTRLFALLYGRYPPFIIPYVIRPDLYKGEIRPAAAYLATLRQHGDDPKYLEMVPWLASAATNLSKTKRSRLVHAIGSSIEDIDDMPAAAALFRILAEIDPGSTVHLDFSPEDPEIRAARMNMGKIMDLPPEVFDRPNIELAHALKQATTISADFYNVIIRATGSYAVYMVDVDYHGLPASLDAMQVRFALKAARDWGLGTPRVELESADALVRNMTSGTISVTMNFLEIDPSENCVRYASAGMPPALLFRTGQPEPLKLMAVGEFIGAGYSFEAFEPREAKESIGDGDLIVLCSDGIIEARAEDGHIFGESRLIATVKELRDRPAKDIVEAIVNACRIYSNRAKPLDDQSVVVVRIKRDEMGPRVQSHDVESLRIAEDNNLRVRATLRRSEDWPSVTNGFVQTTCVALARHNLDDEAIGRFRIALSEAMYNAVKHGTDLGGVITVEIAQLPDRGVEAVVTQQNEWTNWDSYLGSQRRRELKDSLAKTEGDSDATIPLGGATLISEFADSVICDGRRLTLRFKNRSEPDQI